MQLRTFQTVGKSRSLQKEMKSAVPVLAIDFRKKHVDVLRNGRLTSGTRNDVLNELVGPENERDR